MSNHGKFNNRRDEVVYRATLDGTCETLGDVQDFGFYARLTDFYGRDYLLHEDGQGFVTVESFRSGTSWARWVQITEAYEFRLVG